MLWVQVEEELGLVNATSCPREIAPQVCRRLKRLLLALTAVAWLASTSAAGAPGGERTLMESTRPDGSTLHWAITRPEGDSPTGILLVAQGSGCAPATANPAVAAAHAIAPHFALLTVEKVGVGPNDAPQDPVGECPEAYFVGHTVRQRVEDVAQVLSELRGARWWNGKLVLFGGSEGGAVVARLVPRLEPDAAVVFSTGLGETLAASLERVLPPLAAAEAEAKLAEARSQPQSREIWGGNSYRWWADVVDEVLVERLLETKVPVLLIQGARDSHAPVQSARAARDAYAAAGRSELTYWELEGYDHSMTDAAGVSHRDEVFTRIADWVARTVGRPA